MPRVKVKLPDGLLQKAATRAHDEGRHIDELWSEAIATYVEQNKDMTAGAVRSRAGIPGRSPTLNIEIAEDLFQRAESSPSASASSATGSTARRSPSTWPTTRLREDPPTAATRCPTTPRCAPSARLSGA